MTGIDNMITLMGYGESISEAIKNTYKTQRVRVPFRDEIYDISVFEMHLGNKITNALMRANIQTANDFISRVSKHEKINDIGDVSMKTIFYRLIDIGWKHMNNTERAAFLIDVDERNEVR